MMASACRVMAAAGLCAGAQAQPQIERYWVGPPGPAEQVFSNSLFWSPGGFAPAPDFIGVFRRPPAGGPSPVYVAGLLIGALTPVGQVKVRGADTTIRLNGGTLSLMMTPDSLIVGESGAPTPSAFRLEAGTGSGTLGCLGSIVVGAAEAASPNVTMSINSATVTASGLQVNQGSVTIGSGGLLRLDALSGGLPIPGGVIIGGTNPGGPSLVVVGAGGAMQVRSQLLVAAGGMLSVSGAVSATQLWVSPGPGAHVSDLLQIGGVEPVGVGSYVYCAGGATVDRGVLSAQRLWQPGGELALENFAGGASPPVSVSGEARLGGGLRVRSLAAGFSPAVGARFPLLRPASITGGFDVAAFPGFGDQRFLRLEPAPAPIVGVDVVVDSTASRVAFAGPTVVTLAANPRAAAVGRINADVFPDLVLVLPGPTPADPGSLVILTNGGVNAQGVWNGFSASAQITIGRDPATVRVRDVNGDGFDDIVIVETGENAVRVLRNDRAGGFPPGLRTLYPTGAAPVDATVADLDGATGPDIAVANRDDGTLTLLLNTGSGLFGPGQTLVLPSGTRPAIISSGDVDNDKDIDIVVGASNSTSGPAIGVLNNLTITDAEGGRSVGFGPWTRFPVVGAPVAVIVRDLNGDGLPEIAALGSGEIDGGVLAVLRNAGGRGAQGFAPAALFAVGAEGLALTAGDFDSTGTADLAVLARDRDLGRLVRVFRNDSSGPGGGPISLTEQPAIGAGEEPTFAIAADVDNDGQVDLVTGNAASLVDAAAPSVRTRVNTAAPLNRLGDVDGDGLVGFTDLNLALSAYGSFAGGPGYIRAADFNRDGVVDFLDLNILLAWYGR